MVTQGKTLDETVENVKEALSLALDDGDAKELGFVDDPVILITYEMEPVHAT
jgi:predicted RNase H-like HicB family nuclease